MDLKKLIDEHADQDPDVAVAPDENSILDVALDLEQSLAEQGLVRGNETSQEARQAAAPAPTFLDSESDSENDEETIKATRLSAAVEIAKQNEEENERRSGAGKRRILDDEEEEKSEKSPKKPKRMVSDDEEEENPEETRPKSPVGANEGTLMANIFGGTSSDESIVEDADVPRKKKARRKKKGEISDGQKKKRKKRADSSGSETEEKSSKPLSDFDMMMQQKKRERSRSRRKTGIDVVNAREQMVERFIHQMSEAVESDRQANREGKPTLKTVALLPEVIRQLSNADLRSEFLDHDVLPVITNWLAPLPNRSLPYVKIREGLLRILEQMGSLDRDLLKDSCIGKAVMLLYRHPRETQANKRLAEKIIHEWARPIFGLKSDPKELTREEREELDHSRRSQQTRRRLSSGNDSMRRKSIESAMREEQSSASKPGDPGWCPRARVPMPSVRDYVIRPQSIVDAGTSRVVKRGEDRQEKILKQFQEKQKKRHSGGSALRVNLLGGFK